MRDAIDIDEGTSTMEYATVSLVDVDTGAIVITSNGQLYTEVNQKFQFQHQHTLSRGILVQFI
jgi:hypothetical protein